MSTHVDKCVSALTTEKNRKEEWEVSGRLWHDNIDPSIVGPDSSVIFTVLIDPVYRPTRSRP